MNKIIEAGYTEKDRRAPMVWDSKERTLEIEELKAQLETLRNTDGNIHQKLEELKQKYSHLESRYNSQDVYSNDYFRKIDDYDRDYKRTKRINRALRYVIGGLIVLWLIFSGEEWTWLQLIDLLT